MTDTEAAALCRRWQRGDEAAIAELVRGHRAAVRAVVKRLGIAHRMPPWVDRDDLEAAGLRGIWLAALSYNPERGKFITHAMNYIQWKILGSVRPLMVAKRQGLHVSLDEPMGEDGALLEEVIPAPDSTVRVRLDVEDVLGMLTQEDAQVLRALYLEEMTLPELAARSGVSKQGVAQRRDRALRRARTLAANRPLIKRAVGP